MLAARAMFDWTTDARWADAWRESAEELWQQRDLDGLWTQRLYGEAYRGLGPPHGAVGNVLALLEGASSSSRSGARCSFGRPRGCWLGPR